MYIMVFAIQILSMSQNSNSNSFIIIIKTLHNNKSLQAS